MLCMYSLFEFPLSIDFQVSFRTEAKTTNFPLGCGQIETAEMLQLHVSLRPSSVPLSSPSSSTNASPLQNSALSLLICFCNDDCIIESETSVDLVCASSIASACQTNSEMSSSWNLVSSRSLDTIFDGKPVMNWYRNVCWVAGMFSRTHRSYSVLNSIVYSRTFWPEFFLHYSNAVCASSASFWGQHTPRKNASVSYSRNFGSASSFCRSMMRKADCSLMHSKRYLLAQSSGIDPPSTVLNKSVYDRPSAQWQPLRGRRQGTYMYYWTYT